MHKREREYKLVRCEGQQSNGTKRIGARCVLAGLMSLVLVVTAVPAFVFPRQSTVIAAQEEALSDASGGDVTGGDVTGGDAMEFSGAELGREVLMNAVNRELKREEILVALDAGHGGEDEGTAREGGLEKTVNFPKTMYLTFDDGPSAENTTAVLDILKEKNVKATFFVIGENVEKYPEVAKRIVEEGHAIGIHCYNHNYDNLYASVDSYVQDFEKAQEIVYRVTGVETKLFRFPGGSINAYNRDVYQDIIDEMTDRGYIYYDWNASLEDATRDNAPEKLLQNARESTLGRKRVILLAHDVIYNTTLCLEELLEQFPEYRMMPLLETVEPIQF